ncbi:1151_t:CDS:2 [Entrophospora sp. SA101]|nr:5704_t:CDS:2 [Entrophospora candida]CAG8453296.1 5707_t:CDS:2 [Entrophospora candida]CAH1760529.1 10710_t:CDS:2 [Entrophospora sp. SA101]CAJ0893312.1 1151_t:CDS:2 [Entrophospora sp. SA101]CAJ0921615.1 13735_t:CDS:2 [Entrophospora sp. SA101]
MTGLKISDLVHRTLVISLVGIAAYSFIGSGIAFRQKIAKRKESTKQMELKQSSEQFNQDALLSENSSTT